MKGGVSIKSKKLNIYPYLFIAPAIFLVFFFFLIPMIIALGISVTDMDLKGLADYSKISFVGLENYSKLFGDQVFIQSLKNTLFYVVVGVPLLILFSLTLALLLNFSESKFFSFLRGVFYMPSVTNIVAAAVIFTYIYNPAFGLLNYILDSDINWLLGGPIISKISLIILALWRGTGLNMIILLAAIKNIPKTYYEAASIDGATGLRQLFKITLPLLSYAIIFVAITSVIGWIQFFDEAFIMTDGKPLNATLSISLFIYKTGFKNNDFGFAAASSIVLFFIIIAITIVQMKLRKRFEE